MTLHIVTSSPFQSPALDNCLEIISAEDVLVLLADGVYAAACRGLVPDGIISYHIREDLLQRGVTPIPSCLPLDYAQLVTLTEQYCAIHTWR